ncbi:hypothetical protein Neosp_011898 [[Neocosmospora] mangrovei]
MEDREVVLAVAVEVYESGLVVVSSDAEGDGDAFFPDSLAFAYYGKYAGVRVHLDYTSAGHDEVVGFAPFLSTLEREGKYVNKK